jgi:hypothetical protein
MPKEQCINNYSVEISQRKYGNLLSLLFIKALELLVQQNIMTFNNKRPL